MSDFEDVNDNMSEGENEETIPENKAIMNFYTDLNKIETAKLDKKKFNLGFKIGTKGDFGTMIYFTRFLFIMKMNTTTIFPPHNADFPGPPKFTLNVTTTNTFRITWPEREIYDVEHMLADFAKKNFKKFQRYDPVYKDKDGEIVVKINSMVPHLHFDDITKGTTRINKDEEEVT